MMNIREADKRSMTLPVVAVLICAVTLATQVFAAEIPEPVAGAVPGREYRIAAEDVLQITVWKEEGLDKEVIVRPDGGISFPLAGDVPAAGQTPKEVEAEIARRLARYIPDAVVTVSVKELKGMRIYVNGKVNNPGQFTVGRYVDVLQALTLAGGLNVYANADGIKILRREDGKEVVYKFDYDDVKNGKKLEQNIVLHADDVVVVP